MPAWLGKTKLSMYCLEGAHSTHFCRSSATFPEHRGQVRTRSADPGNKSPKRRVLLAAHQSTLLQRCAKSPLQQQPGKDAGAEPLLPV